VPVVRGVVVARRRLINDRCAYRRPRDRAPEGTVGAAPITVSDRRDSRCRPSRRRLTRVRTNIDRSRGSTRRSESRKATVHCSRLLRETRLFGVQVGAYSRAMSPAAIVERLERVVRRHVTGSMPVDPSGELAAMDLSNLLVVYGNWRSRFIAHRPRRVHLSRELEAALPRLEHRATLETIRAEIEAGVSLTPRLSKNIEVAYVPRAERKTGGGLNSDVDALLAHDGLHHLHLGDAEGRQFVGRTRDLLFAAFRDHDAYLVGLYPHGSWGRRNLLERIVRNWPEVELLAHARSAVALTDQYSDEDRWRLMKAGVSVAIEIDGKVYFPLGQTTAGTPLAVTQRVNTFMWELRWMREQGAHERLHRRGADPTLYWTPAVRDDHAGLESSQGFVAFGRLA
jgi:hypothetical protein